MASIDHFDLRSFDLNLLVAFDAMMEERSVTRAAARLKVQQPAMSHSLSTLRVLLQDELFVRVGQSMQPTERARTLAPQVRGALQQLQETLRRADRFDPRTQDRVFRLGFTRELELLVMPDLAARLRQDAPNIRLLSREVDRDVVHHLLDEGLLDLAIGCFDAGASRHRSSPLFEQTLACCFNPRLLDLAVPVDPDAYLRTPHALVTLKDSLQGCLDEALEAAGVQLNVVMAASDFLPILSLVAAAPVLTTLPGRMARRYAPVFGLAVSPLPLELRVPAASMLWSARTDRDPGAEWLRDQAAQVLSDYKG